MRAYANCVQSALARYQPALEVEMLELTPEPSKSRWGRRLEFAAQHWRARRARRRPADLWHVLDGSRAHVASALGPAPVVITVHDIIPWLQDQGVFPGVPPLGAAARTLWRANGSAMRHAAALLCDSGATARDAQRAFGVPEHTCRLVPLALRPAMRRCLEHDAGESSREDLVLHIGNNGFYKNRRGVLQVFARLDRGLPTRLAMAGPPPDVELQRLAAVLGVQDRVDWIHDPDDNVLARLYARAAVLLFPSRYEGFGWPVLEAMAFGLPVVASNAGSLPEVLGPEEASYAPEDYAGMAGAVARLLGSPLASAEAAARHRRRAAAFSERAFAEGTMAAYAAALLTRTKA